MTPIPLRPATQHTGGLQEVAALALNLAAILYKTGGRRTPQKTACVQRRMLRTSQRLQEGDPAGIPLHGSRQGGLVGWHWGLALFSVSSDHQGDETLGLRGEGSVATNGKLA